MRCRISPLAASLAVFSAILMTGRAVADEASKPAVDIQFNRDIRPILADNCFACHGPDGAAREADLRLDTQEGLFADLDDYRIVSPGALDDSELYRRVSSPDAAEQMPPPKSGKKLTPQQIETLMRWIEAGAPWQGHWAFIKPERPPVPEAIDAAAVGNEIDRFIQRKLADSGLRPSAEAERITLVRRLYFDLIGLPPTPEQVEAFVNDQSPDAYARLVDSLLASPHFGERMAIYWLDMVRFADTIGYHSDNPRDIAPYRDYVIAAFNGNKPFDRFTIEQLAGDLLPDATFEQKVASGYNRLNQTTEEGGAQPKEYTVKYAADRVRNASTVWLGATLGCAECHDHKFDPYTTKDFYAFAAFFADIKEAAVGRREPGMPLPSPEQEAELKRLDDLIAPLKKTLETPTAELQQAQAEWEKAPAAAGKEPPKEIAAILQIVAEQRSDAQKQELAKHYRGIAPLLDGVRVELAKHDAAKNEVMKAVPRCLVSISDTPRVTRILPRGNWLDESGEVVTPAIPAFLGGLGVGDRRATRLDLAQWIASRDNPLAARVFVNRLWKLLYGQGLSKSLEDLGTQGEWPTHSGLLDWLAVEFMESGWDVKRLVKRMVMSGTYRQASRASPDLVRLDPYNRLLGRQSRFRLDAEIVRDNALAVSGLLSLRVAGDSVKPYQPEGYWEFLNFPKRNYEHDHGENQYRRGLYTHWQRSFLHPSLMAFDAPSREECTADRPRSNTPQQALVLLNDPTYVEAARVFAEKIIREGGSSFEDRLGWAYRRALSRAPRPEETQLLTEIFEKHRQQFAADKASAEKLGRAGQRSAAQDLDPADLAAWTSIARVILNLHEMITRS